MQAPDSRHWSNSVPHSYPVFPDSYSERGKYVFWSVIRPFHNPVRDALLSLGLIWHAPGRQDFLLGRIAPGHSHRGVADYLVAQGYGNHFIAWEDPGQVVSLRRTQGFRHQYHIRLFEDGEVRAHYEYTPEAHIVLHMRETGMEPRREEFLALLGDKIIPA